MELEGRANISSRLLCLVRRSARLPFVTVLKASPVTGHPSDLKTCHPVQQKNSSKGREDLSTNHYLLLPVGRWLSVTTVTLTRQPTGRILLRERALERPEGSRLRVFECRGGKARLHSRDYSKTATGRHSFSPSRSDYLGVPQQSRLIYFFRPFSLPAENERCRA